jgi:hypothetical protein
MELYHNVSNLKRLKSILESGFILKDERRVEPCVYMTRDFYYLTNRGVRMVFDYDKLRYNYKVKPFCYRGWSLLNNKRFIPKHDEMEERVLSNVDIMKTCIRIDIDRNVFSEIDFNHPLINYTFNFSRNKIKIESYE